MKVLHGAYGDLLYCKILFTAKGRTKSKLWVYECDTFPLLNATLSLQRLYTDKWNKEKTSIHVMPDTPEILQCRVNQITMSNVSCRAHGGRSGSVAQTKTWCDFYLLLENTYAQMQAPPS